MDGSVAFQSTAHSNRQKNVKEEEEEAMVAKEEWGRETEVPVTVFTINYELMAELKWTIIISLA